MITKTFEAIRPIHAPGNMYAFAHQALWGEWLVFYGSSTWVSRSYWLVPGTNPELT
jgi:hypothetical protein